MTVCEEHGDTIVVYSQRECPLCLELGKLEDRIAELEDALNEAQL